MGLPLLIPLSNSVYFTKQNVNRFEMAKCQPYEDTNVNIEYMLINDNPGVPSNLYKTVGREEIEGSRTKFPAFSISCLPINCNFHFTIV